MFSEEKVLINLRALTYRVDEQGKHYTFNPSDVRKFLRDNPEADAVIGDATGNVLGLLSHELLQGCLAE